MTHASATTDQTTRRGRRIARPGDRLEVRGLPGWPTRHGDVLEVLGRDGHERYRVRWEDEHESIVFPSADGVHVTPRKA